MYKTFVNQVQWTMNNIRAQFICGWWRVKEKKSMFLPTSSPSLGPTLVELESDGFKYCSKRSFMLQLIMQAFFLFWGSTLFGLTILASGIYLFSNMYAPLTALWQYSASRQDMCVRCSDWDHFWMSVAVFYNIHVSMSTVPLPNLLILQGYQRARVRPPKLGTKFGLDNVGKYMIEIRVK